MKDRGDVNYVSRALKKIQGLPIRSTICNIRLLDGPITTDFEEHREHIE